MASNTMDTHNIKAVTSNIESLPSVRSCDTVKDDKCATVSDENDPVSQVNEKFVNSDSEISEKSASSDSRSTCVINVRTEAEIEPTRARNCDDNYEGISNNNCDSNSSNVTSNGPTNDFVPQKSTSTTVPSGMDRSQNKNGPKMSLEDPYKIEKVSLQNSTIMDNNLDQQKIIGSPARNSTQGSLVENCTNITNTSSPSKNIATLNDTPVKLERNNENNASPFKNGAVKDLNIKLILASEEDENKSNKSFSTSPSKCELNSAPEETQQQEDLPNETDTLLSKQSNEKIIELNSRNDRAKTDSEQLRDEFESDTENLLPQRNGKNLGNLPRNTSVKSASEFEYHGDINIKTENLLKQQTQGKVNRLNNARSASEIEQQENSNGANSTVKNASTGAFSRKGITKSSSTDIDKPVLHVQFDNKRSISGSTMPVKDPCSSPTASILSSSSSSNTSSSTSEDDDSIGISEAQPPDGGWGWVVVAASFLVNLIADGITFSFGIIYVEFLKYFGEGKSKTAWIGSLFMAMPLLSGPVASFLTDRYGCRKVSIVGSILASTGFIISTFANSMELLFFTFGILAGFGLSLCYVAAVVIVAYYFEKRRSFATGLSVCGSGIGTFIFAPLIQVLLREYGWRGTTLILAGLFLNLAVCGALMRDLPWTSHKRKIDKKKRDRKRRKNNSSAETFSVSNSTNTASAVQAAGTNPTATSSTNEDLQQQCDDRLFSSLVNLPTYVRNGEKVPMEVLELLSTHKNVYNVLMQNYPGLLTSSRSFSDSGRLHENQPPGKFVPTISPLAVEHQPVTSTSTTRPSTTDAAFLWWLKKTGNDQQAMPPRLQEKKHPAYLRDLKMHRLSLTYRGAMLNINRYRLRASSCPDIYRNSMTTIAKEKNQWYAGLWELWDTLVDMLDFSHFAEPRFLLFSMSNFLLYTWYDVPYVYLTDNALENGYSETDASMLISIVGIVNMAGEILLGWAGDRSWVNASFVYAVCMGLCGIVTALVPLLSNYAGLCVVSGAFGFFIAANYSLTSIILVELITIERFTNAYGLLLLVQGVANLIGPPLGGWLYDITGKYDLSFYLAGFFIAMSGLLLVVIPATKRYRYFQTLQRQASGVSDGSIETANDCSPKEPSFHKILASCITGKTEKEEAKINHV